MKVVDFSLAECICLADIDGCGVIRVRILSLFALLVFAASALGQASDRDAGVQLYREGKFSEAASQLESVSTLDPKDRQAWLYLGAVYAHLGRMDDAKKAFRASRMRQTEGLPTFSKKLKVVSKPSPNFDRSVNEKPPVIITVAVEFKADGTIGIVVPFQDKASRHEAAAIEAARNIRFEAAEIDGKPVTTVVALEYAYRVY